MNNLLNQNELNELQNLIKIWKECKSYGNPKAKIRYKMLLKLKDIYDDYQAQEILLQNVEKENISLMRKNRKLEENTDRAIGILNCVVEFLKSFDNGPGNYIKTLEKALNILKVVE